MTSSHQHLLDDHAPLDGRPGRQPRERRERRAVSYCDIWDLVAPGEACPACDDSFEGRLHRAVA